MSGKEALFDIKNLCVQSGQKTLLSVNELCLRQGEISVFIGANGAGKSTLLHALLGNAPSCTLTGSILCLGNLNHQMVKQGKLAWVGQHERFELPLTVMEYALLGVVPTLSWYQKPSATDTDKAWQLLGDFELTDLAHKRVMGLSGGEKQRLAIVRALMQNTDILLFDEPTNHLDIKHERLLFDYLDTLVKTHQKSIVMVLHNLTYAYRFAHTVVALKHGKLIATGTPQDVMTDQTLHTLYDTPITRHHTSCGMIFA